jgi:DNA-binding transcriptional regulator YiaG
VYLFSDIKPRITGLEKTSKYAKTMAKITWSKNSKLIFISSETKDGALMTWNPEKIRNLRCRLGWTQADLARRLNCESRLVQTWESTTQEQALASIELHADSLVLLEKQAEVAADFVFQRPLAEAILDETKTTQVHTNIVKRRFFENN